MRIVLPRIRDIAEAVARYFDVPVDRVLRVGDRSQSVVRARHVAWTVARELTGRSSPELARDFGAKDPGSVLRATYKVEVDPVLGPIADTLIARFRGL